LGGSFNWQNVKIDFWLSKGHFKNGELFKAFTYRYFALNCKIIELFFKKSVTIGVPGSLIGSEFLIVSVIKEL